MELNDLRKEPHLSASSIGDYIDCGLLYKLGRIDKLLPEFRADALEFGSCIHLALSDFHQAKKDGKTMTAKELHEQFERYWKAAAEGQENIQYAEGKDFKTLLGQKVKQKYSTQYCGKGNIESCADAMWAALKAGGDTLAQCLDGTDHFVAENRGQLPAQPAGGERAVPGVNVGAADVDAGNTDQDLAGAWLRHRDFFQAVITRAVSPNDLHRCIDCHSWRLSS